MISPEHIDEQKSEDKPVLSPVEEKQVFQVSENEQPSMEPLLRGVAIGVSLINGGVLYSNVLSQGNSSDIQAYLPILLMGLVVVGSAVLFRSWWAILAVPLGCALGTVLASFLITQSIEPNIGGENLVLVVGASVTVSILIMPIFAIIGTFLGMYWKKRQRL